MVKFGFQNEKADSQQCACFTDSVYTCIRQPFTAKKKNSPKNHPRLIHGSKTEIKKVQDKFFML